MSSSATLADLVPGKYKPVSSSKPILQNWYDQGSAKTRLKNKTKEVHFMKPYEAGDPLKYLDWKAYARTEQLWVKEKFDPSVRSVVIMLDGRASMCWPPDELIENVNSKFVVGCNIALDVLYHHLTLGDRGYIALLDESGALGFHAVKSSHEIEDLHAKFSSDEGVGSLRLVAQTVKVIDKFIFISDALNSISKVLSERRQIKDRQFIHLLSQYEQSLDWLESDKVYQDDLAGDKQFKRNHLLTKNGDYFKNKFATWKAKVEGDVTRSAFEYISLYDSTRIDRYHQLVFQQVAKKD